jgi:hypothetical protein
MPTMTTPQEIAAAIESALEGGGHLVIRFAHSQMRQLKYSEVELLVATLKGAEELPREPTYAMLKALAGDPLILAASDEAELRLRYDLMLERREPQGGE